MESLKIYGIPKNKSNPQTTYCQAYVNPRKAIRQQLFNSSQHDLLPSVLRDNECTRTGLLTSSQHDLSQRTTAFAHYGQASIQVCQMRKIGKCTCSILVVHPSPSIQRWAVKVEPTRVHFCMICIYDCIYIYIYVCDTCV